MAYRPPTNSRFAAVTSAPPPVPVRYTATSSSDIPLKEDDGWKTVSRKPVVPFLEPVVHGPAKKTTLSEKAKETEKTFTADEFPTLGGITIKPTVSKSASTESMAERMKKKLKEEEDERIRIEMEKAEEEEKKKNDIQTFTPGIFISNTKILKQFENDNIDSYNNEYENDHEYDHGMDEDAYGYRSRTPEFAYNDYYQTQSNEEEYCEDEWSK